MSDQPHDENVIVLGATPDEVERRKQQRANESRPLGHDPEPDLLLTPHADEPTDLVTLVRRECHLFHDRHGTPHAAVRTGRRTEPLDLRSRQFDLWLRRALRTAGLPTTRRERRELCDELEAVALFEGPTEGVFVRVAGNAAAIQVDLGGEDDDAITVTPTGWRVVRTPPVRFKKVATTMTLPRPTTDGSAGHLRRFLNVTDDQFIAIVGWIITALRPVGPYPVLILQGEQGTGKSAAAKIIASLVDPRRPALRSAPKSERDLAVAAQRAHVLAFDNLSGLTSAMSDALCRLSTGGGLVTRKLYTDADEVVFEMLRPVVLTGIVDLASRPDLAERAIVVHLPRMRERLDEHTLFRAFELAAPRIFGAIMEALVSAVARVHHVTVAALPRMADFARWVTAAEVGLGWSEGTILAAYRRLQGVQVVESFESDPVAALVPRVVAIGGGRVWRGSAGELLELLRRVSPCRSELPRAGNALTAHLRRVAPVLRACGYDVRFERTATAREVVLEASSSSSSP